MSLDIYLSDQPCPTCGHSEEVFWCNITHNLGKMAVAAGIYGVVWRPEKHGITKAEMLIESLRAAIAEMEANPDVYRAFDSPNGWGMYEHFVPWLRAYLAACEKWPNAQVRASR